jgi:O-antigen/teichoic acid export membrane protein
MSDHSTAAAGRIDLQSDAQTTSLGIDAMSAVPTVHRLWRRALSLGAASAFDYVLQFLLPLVLVRCLDTAAFGQYRLLWLAVGTVTALATLAMPPSLYYFLPRSDRATKRLYINQTLFFLVLGGLIAAWIVSAWNPWLPLKMRGLAQHEAVVPVFVLLWVVASLLDLLPMAEERVMWQAKATVGLAALRAGTLSLTAVLTGELEPVLLALLVFVAFKLALLLGYIAIHHGLRRPIVRWGAFVDQVKYAAPFGASGALYELRWQADQWVAAALFPLGRFASFSIAAILGPLLNLFRQSVNNVFLPSMSRLQAEGDLSGMIELNSRANVMVGTFIYPLLAFAFVFAEDIVTVVYTAAYVDAAPVMRVYTIGFLASVVELSTIMLLLRQGGFVMRLNLLVLPVSIALSWYAANRFGFAGASAGSVTVIYIDRIATLRRIALCSGVAFRQLQNWPSLGRLMLSAMIAAILAWCLVALYLETSAPLVRLAVGGVVLAAVYAAAAVLLGVGRSWLTAVRDFGLRGRACRE